VAGLSLPPLQPPQAPLHALRLYSLESGGLQRTVKQLEDGRTVGYAGHAPSSSLPQLAAPQAVAMDAAGRVLLVEGSGGLNSTLIFRWPD
jgi:hypothetical protein